LNPLQLITLKIFITKLWNLSSKKKAQVVNIAKPETAKAAY